MDIDFFKSINDKYGHKVEDLALQKLTGVCKNDPFGIDDGKFTIGVADTALHQAKNAGRNKIVGVF
jgi:PleD family two-component response regulator